MNAQYLAKARENMPNVEVLVNLVSRRVAQLYRGERPLVKPDTPNQDAADIALKEIAEGKLTAEMVMAGPAEALSIDDLSIDL